MFTNISRLPQLILYATLFLMSACVGQSSADVQPLASDEFKTQYQFTGHPNYPSRLSLSTTLEDIMYSAQVSDFAGKVIATVNNTTLQTMELIIPIGEKQYFVSLATQEQTWLDSIELTINAMNTEQSTESRTSFTNISYSPSSTYSICELWGTQDRTVYLYTQPITSAQALLILPVNLAYKTDARTLDGWYRLTVDNHTGWVNGNEIQLNGDCANLPVDTMIQPTSTTDATTTAPYDVDRHYFDIHGNQGGLFANKISYPNGDSTDIIQATLSNMQADRTIGVIMTCNGNGVESLRWGHAQDVSLKCGDTIALGFTPQASTIQLTVMLPAVSGQQYVEYQLKAMPIAPIDEQHILYVDSNQGGAIQQTLSYPIGDTQDSIAVYAHNLQEASPDNYREYLLIMQCNGTQSEYLRWGFEVANLGCGDQITIHLTHDEAVRYLLVDIAQHDGESFIDYTLYALPSAPLDDTFWFGVDRDNGGVFNETLSSPVGDASDTIEVIMSNLTSTAPNHFREMTLTLYCHGFNTENIRWGLPDNPSLYCGQTVTTAFIHSANQQTIQIVPLDSKSQMYINYTLVVAPKVHEAILKNDTD